MGANIQKKMKTRGENTGGSKNGTWKGEGEVRKRKKAYPNESSLRKPKWKPRVLQPHLKNLFVLDILSVLLSC